MNTNSLIVLGMKHAFPIVCGYVPVGIAYAVAAQQTGFAPWEIILFSFTGYSGSGQILTVSMASQHADLLAIAVGIFQINFRYFIMSACVFNRFVKLSVFKRFFMSHLVTDETFAIFTTAKKELIGIPYFCGLFITSYLSWVLGAVCGILASSILPANVTLALGIAIYALFIAIIVPGGKKDLRVGVMIVATALLNCFLSKLIDMSWAVVVSSVVCAMLGAVFITDKGSVRKKQDIKLGANAKDSDDAESSKENA